MNHAISIELQFFMISVLSGAIILLVYDILRIIRRLIKHDSFFIALEDLFFWVGASLFIFAMIYKENDGIIRGFCVMGMGIGMVLYHFTLSDLLVRMITKLIQMLLSPFVFVIHKVTKFIKFLWNVGKKIKNFVLTRLIKCTKSCKIALNKRKQAASLKHQKRSGEKMQKKRTKNEVKQSKKKDRKKTAHKKIDKKRAAHKKSDRKTADRNRSVEKTTESDSKKVDK